ncbi:MAG: hypothetical protein M1831_002434 [Alyxoria varia]|nr:MAG: hypothetical protein M1831_002434 [Alyxoria varia]
MFRWKASRYDEPFAFDVGHEGSNVLLNSMPLGDRPNGGHLYIVLHLRCINLAEKYVEAAQRKLCGPGRYLDSLAEMNDWENRGVTSLLRLFDLLIARMAESNGCGRETMDPFYHLGAELYWERHYGPYNGPYEFDDSGRGERQKICEADPFGMPRLTSSVLSNLQSQKPGTERVEVNSTDLADLRNRFSSLPTELCDIIEDYVVQKFSHNMPLRCTYILPQYFWRDKLLSGSLFPWLDDLQAQVFAEKEAELGENECWNWELLARGLSQNSMIEYNDETLTLPLGLKNRRRIWILLELARIGDNQEDDPVIGDAKIVHRRVELYDPALLQFCFSWLYPPPEDDEYC